MLIIILIIKASRQGKNLQDNTNEIYTKMQDIFKNIWEQQKYSEAKNGILLTLNLAVFALIIRVYFYIESFINSNNIIKCMFFLLILSFIWHIFLILNSFFPKDSNKENGKLSVNQINIFFFGDIQKLQSNRYLDLLIEKLNINKDDVNKDILLDLANQIVKLSEITQSKYQSFKDSFFRMYVIGFLYSIFFLYLYYKQEIDGLLNG